jgi:prepilin-type N-terminal cleavage/methylation domain-containing protein
MTRRPTAFTLVELLIVIGIIGILAAIVLPRFAGAEGAGRSQASAGNVRQIRQLIHYHANSGQFALAASGFPAQIEGAWFSADRLPLHGWTAETIRIETVALGVDQVFPMAKTFDTNDPAATDAWYNTSNGSFCYRIAPQSSDTQTILLFNEANIATITSLNQTTW